jgi:hypothetical protein
MGQDEQCARNQEHIDDNFFSQQTHTLFFLLFVNSNLIKLTQQILKKDSKAELCYQQIHNPAVVVCAHQLFQVNAGEDENHAAAEPANKSRRNQQFECFAKR